MSVYPSIVVAFLIVVAPLIVVVPLFALFKLTDPNILASSLVTVTVFVVKAIKFVADKSSSLPDAILTLPVILNAAVAPVASKSPYRVKDFFVPERPTVTAP